MGDGMASKSRRVANWDGKEVRLFLFLSLFNE